MVSSILTNNGAMTALQSLKATQKSLLETQNRISTGLKVSTAKDNAATWAVATSMRGDIANYKQVSENLSVSAGIMTTAATGAEQIATLISDIRTQVTSVQDGVKDAQTVQANIDQLIAQIDGIVGSSSFKGVNLLDGSTDETQILASVNANGGAQTPAYITASGYKLSTDEDGLLADLKKVNVESRAAQYSYAEPTGSVDVGDQLSFTFKVGGETKKATFTATTTNMGDMMEGLKGAINTAAGSEIAKIDANGALVVDSSLSKAGAVSFDGETALAKSVDTDSSITLGTPKDLNPPKAKFSYEPVLNDTLTASGGETFEFSFEVDGVAKRASVTTIAGDDFDSMLGKLRDQINQQAGAGNEIASVDDVTGKLVVDAAKATDSVTFDGEGALKKLTGSLVNSTLVAGANKIEFAASDVTGFTSGDKLTYTFTYNGVSQTAEATGTGGTPADALANALANLVTDINTKAGGNPIAYVDNATTPTKFTIDVNASEGEFVLGELAGLDANSSGSIAVANDDGVPVTGTTATDPRALVYKLPSDDTRISEMSFTFTGADGVTSVPVSLQQTIGQSNKDFLSDFAGAINTAAVAVPGGVAFAFIDKDGNLVLDKSRDISGNTDFGVSGNAAPGASVTSTDFLNTTYENYGDNAELSASTSGDYSDLLASLKTVEDNVLAAGAAFGAVQTRIDQQKDFMDKLVDTLTSGVGALVDADMSEEAARLQALQVQEQLGTQALSIANQAPQSILSLFR